MPAPLRRIAPQTGNFSIAFAPMLWEGRGVGAIQVSREPPQPFSDKELALLKTFADQAVIAIQNARLFDEIQAKSRELEMANKHKSEFLANMSHELRTPLNAIIGFSEVLSEKMFGELNDKQLEYLLDIHSLGPPPALADQRHPRSLEDRGRADGARPGDVPRCRCCSTTARRWCASGPAPGLVLALEVEEGLGDWVADVRKLKQIVINLLSNAVKFTPAGGRVTLRARRLEHAVEIAVIDTGVGIAEDQQALVFEEFRQAAATTCASPRARASAWRSPSASSSCMAARSGSRASPAGARPSPSSSPSASRGGAHEHAILIVEDNEKNMKLVRDILRHKGYATLEAITAATACGWRASGGPT